MQGQRINLATDVRRIRLTFDQQLQISTFSSG
jgi:hypothetical protein